MRLIGSVKNTHPHHSKVVDFDPFVKESRSFAALTFYGKIEPDGVLRVGGN